ncbi:hypothetical protein TcasGA2_TC012954 [Tribolium castaneum]|uniref:Tc1-like transposase DDE domain-containing protein n=1 Tax=Tribolium castaneum TaxID=7070 RepID=D6X3F0_TRICA|nr:hypothetical protein TcasGA2_TC012954 [Tribolium castaneum]
MSDDDSSSDDDFEEVLEVITIPRTTRFFGGNCATVFRLPVYGTFPIKPQYNRENISTICCVGIFSPPGRRFGKKLSTKIYRVYQKYARRLYAQRYPNRTLPNSHTFQSTVQHLREHSSFKPQTQDRSRARPQQIANVEDDILDAVAARPGTRILNRQLIGPHILPHRLNAEQYLHFLRDVLFELLDDVNLETRQNLWFLHDGAPCHRAHVMRNWLNTNFPQRWIGTYGPVAWPARSPDLNPCDFFLWDYMKELLYLVPIDNIEQLRDRIFNAAETIRTSGPTVERVKNSLRRRVQCCLNANGGHLEHLL